MRTFRERAVEACPKLYVELVSIIQALALGALAENLTFHFGGWGEFSIRILMYTVIALMIGITWYEYAMSSIYFRWPLDWVDVAIPIVLGLCEFVVIGFLKPKEQKGPLGLNLDFADRVPGFYLALTVFVGLALLAFINREYKAPKAPKTPESEDAWSWSMLGESIVTTRCWLIGAFFGYVIVTVLIFLCPPKGLAGPLFLLLAIGTFLFQAWRCSVTYKPVFVDTPREPETGSSVASSQGRTTE